MKWIIYHTATGTVEGRGEGEQLPTPPAGYAVLETDAPSDPCYVVGDAVFPRQLIALQPVKATQGAEVTVELPTDATWTCGTLAGTGPLTATFEEAGDHSLVLLGRYVGGATIAVHSITTARKAKWDDIKASRKAALSVTTTPLGSFDSDPVGLANIMGATLALTLAGAQAPATVTWKMADNSERDFTPSEFCMAALAVSAGRTETYATSWAVEQQIIDAETVADLEAIQWPSPSP